jgi:transcriptional regulator with XRE-family HTH domain
MLPDGTNRTENGGPVNSPDRLPVDLERLDRERRLRGWTKLRLAEEMGVSQFTVNDIYSRGAAAPETFKKLTDALERSEPSELARSLAGEPSEGAA